MRTLMLSLLLAPTLLAQPAAPKAPAVDDMAALARGTIVGFGEAIAAKRFEAAHAALCEAWRAKEDAAAFAKHFAALDPAEVDMRTAGNRRLVVYKSSSGLARNGTLYIRGMVRTRPSWLRFQLQYRHEQGRWRLSSFSLYPRSSRPPAPAKIAELTRAELTRLADLVAGKDDAVNQLRLRFSPQLANAVAVDKTPATVANLRGEEGLMRQVLDGPVVTIQPPRLTDEVVLELAAYGARDGKAFAYRLRWIEVNDIGNWQLLGYSLRVFEIGPLPDAAASQALAKGTLADTLTAVNGELEPLRKRCAPELAKVLTAEAMNRAFPTLKGIAPAALGELALRRGPQVQLNGRLLIAGRAQLAPAAAGGAVRELDWELESVWHEGGWRLRTLSASLVK